MISGSITCLSIRCSLFEHHSWAKADGSMCKKADCVYVVPGKEDIAHGLAKVSNLDDDLAELMVAYTERRSNEVKSALRHNFAYDIAIVAGDYPRSFSQGDSAQLGPLSEIEIWTAPSSSLERS